MLKIATVSRVSLQSLQWDDPWRTHLGPPSYQGTQKMRLHICPIQRRAGFSYQSQYVECLKMSQWCQPCCGSRQPGAPGYDAVWTAAYCASVAIWTRWQRCKLSHGERAAKSSTFRPVCKQAFSTLSTKWQWSDFYQTRWWPSPFWASVCCKWEETGIVNLKWNYVDNADTWWHWAELDPSLMAK